MLPPIQHLQQRIIILASSQSRVLAPEYVQYQEAFAAMVDVPEKAVLLTSEVLRFFPLRSHSFEEATTQHSLTDSWNNNPTHSDSVKSPDKVRTSQQQT